MESKTKFIVIWGISGHAKVLKECLNPIDWSVVAMFDNRFDATPIFDVPVFFR